MLTELGRLIAHIAIGGGRGADLSVGIQAYTLTGISKSVALSTIFGQNASYNQRIVFGTNTSLDPSMITLENFYNSNPNSDNQFFSCARAMYHPAYKDGKTTQSFLITNETEEDITYTCFGRTIALESNSTTISYVNTALVAAWMLKEPVTVPAGESRTIQIEIDVNDI